MKLNNQIPTLNGETYRYKWLRDVAIDESNVTLKDVIAQVEKNSKQLIKQQEILKNSIVVDRNKPYFVNINGKPVKVESLEIYDVVELEYDLKHYKIVNGRIVLDERRFL